MVCYKHKYISNPTVTPTDNVLAAAQDMADALQVRMERHLGNNALYSLLNPQKIFAQAATTQKAADNQQPDPPRKNKLTSSRQNQHRLQQSFLLCRPSVRSLSTTYPHLQVRP